MREISRTPIYRVRCYKLICLRNRANPVKSHAFHTVTALDSNDLKNFSLFTLFSHYSYRIAENYNRKTAF